MPDLGARFDRSIPRTQIVYMRAESDDLYDRPAEVDGEPYLLDTQDCDQELMDIYGLDDYDEDDA
jgi:hypothetical protein